MPAVASVVSVLLHACAVCAGTADSSKSQVLLHTGSTVGLSKPADQIADHAMLALDTDRDGKVSSGELTAYGLSQGIDSTTATHEFTALDVNGDGTLDASEVAGVFDDGNTAPLIQAVAIPATASAAWEQPQAVSQKPSIEGRKRHKRTSFLSAASKSSRDMTQLMKSRADAQKVVVQLDTEARSTAKAMKLEQHAQELRAKATALQELTSHQALDAAEEAAGAKAKELMQHLEDLDLQAKKDEVQAAMLRARLHADMEHSITLSAVGSVPPEQLSHLPK